VTRIDKVVVSGVFSLDGQDFDVDNNVWLIGDDSEVLVIDAAHEADKIIKTIAGRRVLGIVSTHGHNDHINAAGAVADATGARIFLHPDDGRLIDVAGLRLEVLHTPGHSPGAVCLYAPELGVLLSGDTLFKGGPGATGRSYSSFPTILESIRARLLTLPSGTRVLTGHGEETTIGGEAADLDAWVARGH
jgi:glyoxylase-like metal-dependent hydrolase (beta-lactamase superfamily II)